MKDYLELKTPEGLKRQSHFFLRDNGDEKTTFEMYIFTVLDETGVELPNGYNARFGDIVQAQAHIEDNFNNVQWIISHPEDYKFFRWLNRVLITEKNDYEIVENPLKK